MNLPDGFPHKAPAGYSYEVRDFKRNIVSIWLQHHDSFSLAVPILFIRYGDSMTQKKSVTYCTHQSQTCGNQ